MPRIPYCDETETPAAKGLIGSAFYGKRGSAPLFIGPDGAGTLAS